MGQQANPVQGPVLRADDYSVIPAGYIPPAQRMIPAPAPAPASPACDQTFHEFITANKHRKDLDRLVYDNLVEIEFADGREWADISHPGAVAQRQDAAAVLSMSEDDLDKLAYDKLVELDRAVDMYWADALTPNAVKAAALLAGAGMEPCGPPKKNSSRTQRSPRMRKLMPSKAGHHMRRSSRQRRVAMMLMTRAPKL